MSLAERAITGLAQMITRSKIFVDTLTHSLRSAMRNLGSQRTAVMIFGIAAESSTIERSRV